MAEDKYININNHQLHYRESGSGDPIILMHGWGCEAKTLESIERTAAQTHHVYNLDLPGFGSTTEPDDTWGVDTYTLVIECFCKALGIEKPSLLGHSFGGRLAIVFASRNKVDKVVLVDAAGVKPKRSLSYYAKVYSFKAAKHLANALLPKDKAKHLIDKMRGKSASADYAAASERMRAVLSRVVNEDLTHLMPKIKAPTLLIWGENDTATPLSDAKTMERLIPEAGLVSFPGCGHYSFLDNPVQFAAVLNSFLKS